MKRKLMTLLLILSLVTPLVSATLHARPVYAENAGTTEHMDEAAEEATTMEETPALDDLSLSPATVEESPSEATELRTLDETQVLQEVPVVTRTELLPELELLAVYATGWTNQALEIELFLLEKMSGNEAGIKKLEGRTAASDFWTEITDSRTWLMRENGTLYLRCEATDGQTLNHELSISNIDTGKPSVNASINNALVSIRATDDISGVASIYVNDYPFTDLKSGNLDLLLQDYDTYFEELMIYAVDHAGNRSLTYSLKNPYYKKTESTQLLATPSTTERPAVITPSPVTEAKGTLTDETTDGKGTVTEDTVIPTPTGYQTNVPTPTLAPNPTAPDETRPFRTDTDQEPTLAGSADQAAKEFLSIKTKSGKIFYLIIDRMKSNDNVYLVTEVDEADLMHFTDTDSSPNVVALPHPDSQVQVSLPKPSDEKPVPLEPMDKASEKKPISPGTIITIILVLVMAVGGVYYLKVVKPQQQYPSEADFFNDDYLNDTTVYDDDTADDEDDIENS